MTTQNTEPENNDFQTTVGQVSSALDAPATFGETGVAASAQEEEAHSQSTEASNTSDTAAISEPGQQTITEEEKVQPFTDFIEEFRQAEERFASLLQEPEVAPLSPLIPPEPTTGEGIPAWENTPLGESTLLEEIPFAIEVADAEVLRSAEPQTSIEHDRNVAEDVNVPPAPQAVVEVPAQEEQPPIPPTPRTERPISPLLRPPTRIRGSRHGNAQQHREQSIQAAQAETKAATDTDVESAAPVEVPQEAAPVEPVPAQEQQQPQEEPRPARRYRFDRPAHTAASTTNAEKEQAAPAAEEAGQSAGPETTSTAEVPPEELPPLEYSELQAATSRRRRRRRSSSASAPAATTASTPAAAKPAAPEPAPAGPDATSPHNITVIGNAVSPAPAGQYSLLSGYTVNQMNQGSPAGPFMAPEPSPARGSGSTNLPKNVRPLRSETQRTGATQVTPARPLEPVVSPASINHLANVIQQAIQTQTDRMVAELRRANQTPTNISVALPPFPSTERVGIFVDVANLLYSARTQRITIDFGKLLDFLRGNRRLVRAHAYCPTSAQPGDDQMFLQAVKGLGYRITTKNYKTFSSGAKKADLDLDLCMDVVRLVDGKAVDCIVLVSGDSDFMPMLDYCSDHGVRVEVAAFDESMSATLRQSCDLFINLSVLDEIRA